WQAVDFGVKVRDDATIEIVEAGTSRGSFGGYAAGDRFRVEVRDGAVRYLRNGGLFYTSAAAPAHPLHAIAPPHSAGPTATDLALEPLLWTGDSGVTTAGNSLTKIAADGWNAGATSTRSLAAGDGFVEFTAVETDKRRAV